MSAILGVSAWYHDSAAALLVDGRIVAAAQEERFTRKKHDPAFPARAVEWCLREAGLRPADLDHVAFYDKPLLKFARILETTLAFAPRGFWAFARAMPPWMRTKLHVARELRAALPGYRNRIVFGEHHRSHAASAFFPSPFERAAVLTLDGVGEWATTTLGVGEGHRLRLTRELRFPHSLGLLYSAFTTYCGFRVNSGEYKLMGLAPYGEPRYAREIREHLVDLAPDGSFRLDLSYFDWCVGERMTSPRFHARFGGAPREPEAPIEPRHLDLAASIQVVVEDVVLAVARHLHAETGARHLCLAGGVALNCVANGRLLREGPFDDLWVQPAAGDAGGALGVALHVWHELLGHARVPVPGDAQQGSLLGPSWSDDEVEAFLRGVGARFRRHPDEDALVAAVVERLAAGKVVGWMQGRAEFGPRALGNRSILGDPRDPAMQSVMNRKIKFRESFRPFAPAVLADRAADWFDLDRESPYMLLVAPIAAARRRTPAGAASGLDRVREIRSEIPAVTHVDGSARIQTVDRARNPRFHALLRGFEAATGCPVLVNTSFNVRGEPMVSSPDDAWRCFRATAIDTLVIGAHVLDRADQPMLADAERERHLAGFGAD